MVLDHQGEHASQHAAIRSIAQKIGCSGETLRNWVRQAERDQGLRAGPPTEERERIKALERENRDEDRGPGGGDHIKAGSTRMQGRFAPVDPLWSDQSGSPCRSPA